MKFPQQQVHGEAFDQPEFHGNPTKIFICSSPRTGSWMLGRYMINAGLGIPAEYFNRLHIPRIAQRFGVDGVEDLGWKTKGRVRRFLARQAGRDPKAEFVERYAKQLVRRRTRDGIFAAKLHFHQYWGTLRNPPGWRFLDGGVFVHLYREDLLGQAISYHFSVQTGRWGFDEEVTTPPATNPDFFAPDRISAYADELAREDAGWRAFFACNEISALRVSYEETRADPNGVLAEIARRAGIDPAALKSGYTEAEDQADSGRIIPSKREVRRHFVETGRHVSGGGGPDMTRVPKSSDDSERSVERIRQE